MNENNEVVQTTENKPITLEDALRNEVSINETSMAGTFRGDLPDKDIVDDKKEDEEKKKNIETIEEILDSKPKTAESAPVEDTVDYTTDKPYIKINSRSLLKILVQISPIINESSNRAVSRGITLRVISSDSVEVITPNELYYYKAILPCETTLPNGSVIFIEYKFLTKMSKFIPQQTLIYKDTNSDGLDIYYIRMVTDDLELVNTQLIESDKKKLDYEFNVTNEIKSLEPSELLASLSTFSSVVNFESDSNRKQVNIKDEKAMFKSPLVYARSTVKLNDMVIKLKNIQYIIKTIGLLEQGENLVIKNTDSQTYTRYAICTNNSYMIANYSDATSDDRINGLFDSKPAMTLIDYGKLKYQLDYASSITYALGTIKFTVKDNKLSGQLKLNNGNFSPLEIPLLGDFLVPEGTTFNVNTKTFLSSLNSLDASLATSIGYKDGLLYVSNDNIDLILLTI